ncbi:Tetraspanin-1, partial [Fragariocoptes setiger]
VHITHTKGLNALNIGSINNQHKGALVWRTRELGDGQVPVNHMVLQASNGVDNIDLASLISYSVDDKLWNLEVTTQPESNVKELVGLAIIVVSLWVLATSSSSLKQLFDGKLPVTYFFLGLGFILFINGILGCSGASRRNRVMMKIALFISFLIIIAELGALVTISIFRANSTELIDQTWKELNPTTKNLIQKQLTCCALNGPIDYDSSREIDPSCYHHEPMANLSGADSSSSIVETGNRVLNTTGCRAKIADFFFENRLILLAIIAGVFGAQIITMLLLSSAIGYAKKRHDSLEELDAHGHHGATYM